MGVDQLGNIWVAHYAGGEVLGINPDGILLARIRLPQGQYPTNITLDRNEDTMYVTEAGTGVLYAISPN